MVEVAFRPLFDSELCQEVKFVELKVISIGLKSNCNFYLFIQIGEVGSPRWMKTNIWYYHEGIGGKEKWAFLMWGTIVENREPYLS